MAKKQKAPSSSALEAEVMPVVAATLAGVIYQARLLNRQSKLNIAEEEVIADVVSLWRIVRDALAGERG
jgi:hypothetical protein